MGAMRGRGEKREEMKKEKRRRQRAWGGSEVEVRSK